jgi:hypothetical protein
LVRYSLAIATKYLPPLGVLTSMALPASPPEILVGLVLFAIVILVGRFFLKIAWKLVVLGILAVGVLWLLGAVGL